MNTVLDQALEPGERLLWAGRDHSSLWRAADFLWVPLGAAMMSGAVYWLALAWEKFSLYGPGDVSWVFWVGHLVVAAAAGLYLALGRFIVKAIRRARTQYGLTDRRAMKAVGGLGPARLMTAPLRRPEPVFAQRLEGGCLTLWFEPPAGPLVDLYENAGLDWLVRLAAGPQVVFYGIDDILGIQDALRRGLHDPAPIEEI